VYDLGSSGYWLRRKTPRAKGKKRAGLHSPGWVAHAVKKGFRGPSTSRLGLGAGSLGPEEEKWCRGLCLVLFCAEVAVTVFLVSWRERVASVELGVSVGFF
jgi:hypothetical protein